MARIVQSDKQKQEFEDAQDTTEKEKQVEIVSTDMVIINLLQEQNAILVEVLKALQPLTTEVPKPESKD